MNCCRPSLRILWAPRLICDLFSRLWDSICFMKMGQVGSLNLNWNCLDIGSVGWCSQWREFSLHPSFFFFYTGNFCSTFSLTLTFFCNDNNFAIIMQLGNLCISSYLKKQKNGLWLYLIVDIFKPVSGSTPYLITLIDV